MTDELDLKIEQAVKAGIEAFMKADDEEKKPEEDKKEEKKDDSEEKKDEKPEKSSEDSEKSSEKPDFGGEKEEKAPEKDENGAEPAPPAGGFDVKSLSDDELVEFIELAAQKMGLDDVVDAEPGLGGEEMPQIPDETA